MSCGFEDKNDYCKQTTFEDNPSRPRERIHIAHELLPMPIRKKVTRKYVRAFGCEQPQCSYGSKDQTCHHHSTLKDSYCAKCFTTNCLVYKITCCSGSLDTDV